MDFTLWALALVAVASAVAAGRAAHARARARPDRPRWSGGVWLLALGVGILAWAALSYAVESRNVAQAISLVAPGETRTRVELAGRSELSSRFAWTVAAALPAIVFGVGFLPVRRPSNAP